MKPSRHNIISRIYNSDDYFIVNLLTENADVIPAAEAEMLLAGKSPDDNAYSEKGYVSEASAEEKVFRSRYLDFIDERDNDEVQLFYVNNYSCNFDCSYCYQSGYPETPAKYTPEVTDSFFDYIRSEFKNRKYYITLFGGEPLLPSNDSFLAHFLEKCRETGTEIAIVTNGYHLAAYLPLLAENAIREIQVTLDGTADMHNARRNLRSRKGTFSCIVEGIDAALDMGMPVNLRMVIDRENINELPSLASYAIEKGWTRNSLFKTQLGRNYELHYCQSGNSKLFSRLEMYSEVYSLIKQHPEILEFHKPAMSVSKYLFENGTLPAPLYDSCPGCKTEWAFDYTGRVYSCTATVGKQGEELGTFWPEVNLNQDAIDDWQYRDIMSIPGCRDCNLALACGGGCASVARNRNGLLLSPDCRPVKELISLGMSLYSEST